METIKEWGPANDPPVYRLSGIDNATVRISRLNDDGTEAEGISIVRAFAPTLADTLQRLSDVT